MYNLFPLIFPSSVISGLILHYQLVYEYYYREFLWVVVELDSSCTSAPVI